MKLSRILRLDRCPHCGSANAQFAWPVRNSPGGASHTIGPWVEKSGMDRMMHAWAVYQCAGCAGCILARGPSYGDHMAGQLHQLLSATDADIAEIFPPLMTVDDDLPERARTYLAQAFSSLHAPDGAVMLAASAIDAMLKEVGLKDGSLYGRIEQARDSGKITADMATWAHQVRLDANDPRHADEATPHHDSASARRAVDFARAMGEYLFALPKRVTRGIAAAAQSAPASK